MSNLPIEELLAEVSIDEPCGPDMEYDPLFQEMERASAGKPEQQTGDSVIAAEEPDWRTVKKNALQVMARSKDLRAACFLTHASLNIDGWPGFADGLQLVEGMIGQYWDGLHPALDPDDDNDPTMRVNIINSLSDENGALRSCQVVPIVAAKGVGAFSKRDLAIAAGELSLPDNYAGEPPSAAIVEAAFMQSELEDLVATAEALSRAKAAVDGINRNMAEHIPLTETPDLDPLSNLFAHLLSEVNEVLQRRGVVPEGAEPEATAVGGAPAAGISGTVQSREDVVRVLDQICEFYRRAEPSSPVPILIHRARKLVNMDFMDIMRDLTPGGLSEAENIRGPEEG